MISAQARSVPDAREDRRTAFRIMLYRGARGKLRKRSRNRPDNTNLNHQTIIRRVVIPAILDGRSRRLREMNSAGAPSHL
jgi:hypothetical protein